MKKTIFTFVIILFSTTSVFADFSFTFDWGDIKKCTTGNPNKVQNPIFNLTNVPDGTIELITKFVNKKFERIQTEDKSSKVSRLSGSLPTL